VCSDVRPHAVWSGPASHNLPAPHPLSAGAHLTSAVARCLEESGFHRAKQVPVTLCPCKTGRPADGVCDNIGSALHRFLCGGSALDA
jgi:hypothetical protein